MNARLNLILFFFHYFTKPGLMGPGGKPKVRVRDNRKQKNKKVVSKPQLKKILEGPGEAIGEDAFDYTDLPRRLERDVPKHTGKKALDAQEYVRSLQSRGPGGPFLLIHSRIEGCPDDVELLAEAEEFDRGGDYKFLLNQATKGFDPKISLHAMKQIRWICRTPVEVCQYELNDDLNYLPENDSTYKMEITNPSGSTNGQLTSFLRKTGWEKFKKFVDDLQLADAKYEVYLTKMAFEKLNSKRGKKILTRAEMTEFMEVIDKRLNSVPKALASLLIGNSRVIYPHVYFPALKDVGQLDELESVLTNDRFGSCDPNEVIADINELLLDLQFVKSLTPDLIHEFKECTSTRDNYLWAKILYKPTPRAQELFKYGFLHPSDEILSWNEGPMVRHRWQLADVEIQLGLEMTPPKRTIVDRVRRNLERDLGAATHKKKLKAVVGYMSKMKPYRKISDPFDMSCVVKFCYQFCAFCHTTDHTFQDCPRKGCYVCGNDYHSRANCPEVLKQKQAEKKEREEATESSDSSSASYMDVFDNDTEVESEPEYDVREDLGTEPKVIVHKEPTVRPGLSETTLAAEA